MITKCKVYQLAIFPLFIYFFLWGGGGGGMPIQHLAC